MHLATYRFLLIALATVLLLVAMPQGVRAGLIAGSVTQPPAPQCSEPLDVLIIMDVSSSMQGQLDIAKQQSGAIITALQAQIPDLQFGVASVADYPLLYGDAQDYPWHLDQPIVSDVREVQAALARITLLDGGDSSESYVRALYEAQDAAKVGWRANSRHMIVFWGDSTAHDPDPGVDGILGTSDDLRFEQVLSMLRERSIYVYSIGFGSESTDFQRMASATAGEFLPARSSSELPGLITQAVQRGCAVIAPPPFIPAPAPTSPISFNPWCLAPLIVLVPLLLFLFFKRRAVRNAIRRKMPLPSLGAVPDLKGPQPTPLPSVSPLPAAGPASVGYQPALIIGLGESGRWTLAYLKQTLQETDATPTVDLLAIDLAFDANGREAPPIALVAPDVRSGATNVTLEQPELCWLNGDSAALQETIRTNPKEYPHLHAWQSSLTGGAPHIGARLTFLADLSMVQRRIETALDALHQRQGADIYVIAGLGEAVGAGALIDMARLIQFVGNQAGLSIAIHAVIYLPDVLEPIAAASPETQAAAFAVWRTLERSQTHFGHQPPNPLPFDLSLLGSHQTSTVLDSKLFSTCGLFSADRTIGSLVNFPPQHGVYPMVADMISASLELPAAATLHEHRTNVNSRIGQAQARLDTALYSSVGTFTYRLQPAAILQEATDRLLNDLAEHVLSAGRPADEQPFFSALLSAANYDLYRQAAAGNSGRRWDRDAVLGLLELSPVRGQLLAYAHEGLPQHVRYELLRTRQRGGAAIRTIIQHYCQQHLGDATTTGDWRAEVAANAAVALNLFRSSLLCDVATLLNVNSEPGRLACAVGFVTAIADRMATLQVSLNEHAEARAVTLSELHTAADKTAAVFSRRTFSLGRWLLGYSTSTAEEQALARQQTWLNAELEVLVALGAAEAAGQMHMVAQKTHEQLVTFVSMIRAEQQMARQRLTNAQLRRLAQLDLGRVRHEWGLPHTDVTMLREYSDPQTQLPTSERLRRDIQTLRNYLAGRHIDTLLRTQPAGLSELLERLFWTWDNATAERVLRPVVNYGDAVKPIDDGMALRTAALALYRWVWELRLPELLVMELDTPSWVANQLDDERVGPSIRYLPTLRDQHELHTFLIVPPAHDAQGTRWFEQVVAAQEHSGTGTVQAFHKFLEGSNPYRVTYLTAYELIGALERGALPAYDSLAAMYAMQKTIQTQLAVTTNEALAACAEQQQQIVRQPLHRKLVDTLHDPARVALFAQALVCGVIGHDRRSIPARIVVGSDGELAHDIVVIPDDGSSAWLAALRWFVSAADDATVRRVESSVAATLPSIDAPAYRRWLETGLPATLRAGAEPAEHDLAALIQALLEPMFTGAVSSLRYR